MDNGYFKLATHSLPKNTQVFQFLQNLPEKVTMASPAIDVMTDLRRVKAVTVSSDLSIDSALQKMISEGVRLLLVTASDGAVIGAITAHDILGEKPIRLISQEHIPHSEIQVAHVMTPRNQLEALDMEDVYQASVGDVVEVLREARRQHALVLDRSTETTGPLVRGIFSITQIGKQLGMEIQATGRVQSFAEMEAWLIHGEMGMSSAVVS
ncbi:CBS domain containing protein [Nitrosococcus oceani ATCC 19707]|uniref:CBS domain containing protein n=2 Tax=Nitrosococcus oceani TaxID=1229 RepID=Q3JEW1_NITOC|nr:CBS domain-containing protein [Nitrosococcus oceani]ABA56635.1 CBS domain containing protein [Nitrosococcus oceani ATCC 19707]EDZ65646.1 CBS domain pair protein [Nitrosococcus oceani AFC27]KFI20880.1 histidine kinase [Nitrosococcus oceani C-27]GEM20795.1 histidine kinase [Nitrosococcus oceani]